MAGVAGNSVHKLSVEGPAFRYAVQPAGRGTARSGSTTGVRAAGSAACRPGAAKPAVAPSGSIWPGPVPVTVAVRANDDDNDEDAADQPSTPGRPRATCRRDRFVAGSVRGTFHPDLYMSSQDCITYKGKRIGRSRFEKLGNSSMAKWHRSIRVIRDDGELEPLGEWLTRHGLPVLKGKQRISRKRTKRVPPLRLPISASAAAAAAAAAAGYCGGSGDPGQDSSADEGSSGTPRPRDDGIGGVGVGTPPPTSASACAPGSASVPNVRMGYGAAAQQLHKALTVAAQLAVAAGVAAPVAGRGLQGTDNPVVKREELPLSHAAPMSWGSPQAASASDVDGGSGRGDLGGAPSDCFPAEAATVAVTVTAPMRVCEASAAAVPCREPMAGVTTAPTSPWDASSFAAASAAAAAAASQWQIPSCAPAPSTVAPAPASVRPNTVAPSTALPPAGPPPAHPDASTAFTTHPTAYPIPTNPTFIHHDSVAASSSNTITTATNPLLNTASSKTLGAADGAFTPNAVCNGVEMGSGGYGIPCPSQLQSMQKPASSEWIPASDAPHGVTWQGGCGNGSGPLPPCGAGIDDVGDLVAGGSPVLLDSLCDLWNDDADEDADNPANAVMWALLCDPGSGGNGDELAQEVGSQLPGADTRGVAAANAADADVTRIPAPVSCFSGAPSAEPGTGNLQFQHHHPSPYAGFHRDGILGGGCGGGMCPSDPSGAAAAAATPGLPATPGTGCSTAACSDRTGAAAPAALMMTPSWPGATTPVALTRQPSQPSFASAGASLVGMQRSSSTAVLRENLSHNPGGFGAGLFSSPSSELGLGAAPGNCSADNLSQLPSATTPILPAGTSRTPAATSAAIVPGHCGGMLARPLTGEPMVATGHSGMKVEGYNGSGSDDVGCLPTSAMQQQSRPQYPLAASARELPCISGSSNCLQLLQETTVAATASASAGKQQSSQPGMEVLPPPWMPPPVSSSNPGAAAGNNPVVPAAGSQEEPTVLPDACTGVNKSSRGSAATTQICGNAPGSSAAVAVTAPHAGSYLHAAIGPARRPFIRGYPAYYHPGYYLPYPPYPAAYCPPYPPPYPAYGRARLVGPHGTLPGAGPSLPCSGGGWPVMPLMPPGVPPPPHMYRGPPRTARMYAMDAANRSGDTSTAAAGTAVAAGEGGHLDNTSGAGTGSYYGAVPGPWAESLPQPPHPSRSAELYLAQPLMVPGHPAAGELQQQPQQPSPYPYDWPYGSQGSMMPMQPPHHHHPLPDEDMWSLQSPSLPPSAQVQIPASRASAAGAAAGMAPHCAGGSGDSDVVAKLRAPSAGSGTNEVMQMPGANATSAGIGGGVGGLDDPGAFVAFGANDPWHQQW